MRRALAAGAMLTLAGCAVTSVSKPFDGPLQVSADGRHLTWHDGTPFYYVADTPWQLLASLDLPQAKEYIDIRAAQGFTALQLVATPWSFDDAAAHWDFEGEQGQARTNAYGEPPFFSANGDAPVDNDDVRFDRPNDAYWRHVDVVLDYLAAKGMAAYFIPLWASNFSRHFTADAHYAIGKTLGARYRGQNNLIWVLGGDEARVSLAKYRRLLAGLRDAEVTQLVTMHPRSGRSSSDHLTHELDFHSVQDRGDVAGMVRRIRADYRRAPAKPTFLTETWYEHDKAGGVFGIHKPGDTPAFRAHYWAARLSGGFGEGYGGWTIWLNLSRWREDIRRTGALAIATHMRNILASVDWHHLVPDDAHLAISADPAVHVARSDTSKSAVAYFESPTPVTLNADWFGGEVLLDWYEPGSGVKTNSQTAAANVTIRPPLDGDSVLVATLLSP